LKSPNDPRMSPRNPLGFSDLGQAGLPCFSFFFFFERTTPQSHGSLNFKNYCPCILPPREPTPQGPKGSPKKTSGFFSYDFDLDSPFPIFHTTSGSGHTPVGFVLTSPSRSFLDLFFRLSPLVGGVFGAAFPSQKEYSIGIVHLFPFPRHSFSLRLNPVSTFFFFCLSPPKRTFLPIIPIGFRATLVFIDFFT